MARRLTRREMMLSGAGAALIAGAGGFSYLTLRKKPAPYRHIILLVADTLRADRVGCYGYKRKLSGVERSTTPNLDALADSGALFEEASAQSDWTETSMASMLYSTNPVVNTDHHTFAYLPKPDATLAYMLDYNYTASRHHTKIAVQSNALLVNSPFANGFDLIYNVAGFPRVFRNNTTEPTKLLIHERADVVNDKALEVIDEAGDDSLFLYIHYMDVHETYSPVTRYAKLFPKLPPYDFGDLVTNLAKRRGDGAVEKEIEHHSNDYDASVMFLDEEIGRLLGELDRRGILADSLVVFASDHGQSLGEKDTVGHGQNLFPEETHVPLIVAGCGIPHVRVRTRVRNIDILATVAECLRMRPRLDGESLYPLIRAAAENRFTKHREVFSCMDYPPKRLHQMKEMLISPAGIAYIKTTNRTGRTTLEELYDTNADPRMSSPIDENDFAEVMRTRLAQLKSSVSGHLSRPHEKAKYTEDNPIRTEQLRALGYIN